MENECLNDYLNLINYVGELIAKGIEFGDIKLNFTMLDYYSITTDNIRELLKIAKKIQNKNNNQYPYLNNFIDFASVEGFLVRITDDPKEVFDQRYTFLVDDEKYSPSIEEIEDIFHLFDVNAIPKYNILIFLALQRKSLGIPVLPLLSIEEEKTNTR